MPQRSEDPRDRVDEAAAAKALAKEITDQAHAILDEAQRRAEALVDRARRRDTAA